MPGIGTKETELIATLSNKRKRVFSVADAAELLHISREAASDLVLELLRKRKLLRIEKARYLVIPPEAWSTGEYTEEGIIVASQLISPYYLSYWTALSFYGWTEQPSKTIFVATTKLKRPVDIKGVQVKFVKLRMERFFGFEEQWVGNERVTVADREKTIVDCLDQPRYCGEVVEAAKGLWNGRKEIDFDKVLNYAIKMGNRAIIKRLGYLMDILEIQKTGYKKKLRGLVTSGYVPLDPGKGRNGSYVKDWGLIVNISPENLTEWKLH